MTAVQVIRQMEKLPSKERRKVFAYVDAALERREQRVDRKAIAAARLDPRPAMAWPEAKRRFGVE